MLLRLDEPHSEGVLGCSFAFCPLMAAVGRVLMTPGCIQQCIPPVWLDISFSYNRI